ncbi:hypothetical protein VCHENC02_3834B, partial [Vibrio harveyi]
NATTSIGSHGVLEP